MLLLLKFLPYAKLDTLHQGPDTKKNFYLDYEEGNIEICKISLKKMCYKRSIGKL